MELLSEELSNYLENSCEPENDLLKHINRETHLKVSMPRMLSGHYQGRLLSLISKMISPQRILEIGTFTGYATLCLAEGLQKNGLIYTIDINEELEDMVRVNFKKSDFDPQIKYQIGDAKQIIPTLKETFDLVLIDAERKNNAS
jgi:predicted O-methyltransferase YrrM